MSEIGEYRASIPRRLVVHVGYSHPVHFIPQYRTDDIRDPKTRIALHGGGLVTREEFDRHARARGWIVTESVA